MWYYRWVRDHSSHETVVLQMLPCPGYSVPEKLSQAWIRRYSTGATFWIRAVTGTFVQSVYKSGLVQWLVNDIYIYIHNIYIYIHIYIYIYMHWLIPTSKTCVERSFAKYLYVHASYSSPNWFWTCNLWLPSNQAPGPAISNMPVPEFKSDLRLNFYQWGNQPEPWDSSRVPYSQNQQNYPGKRPQTVWGE